MADTREWTRYELRDPARNHYKFWAISEPSVVLSSSGNWSVTCLWGRIGTAGSLKAFLFQTHKEAKKYYDSKVYEKTREGYILAKRYSVAASQAPADLLPQGDTAPPSAILQPQPKESWPGWDPSDPFKLPWEES